MLLARNSSNNMPFLEVGLRPGLVIRKKNVIFCFICILLCLYYDTCILLLLNFISFVFCFVCIMTLLYFVTVVLTNPKLKSKVQVQTDDWIYIKIGFSNHPASYPETFQRNRVERYIQNKNCKYIFVCSEACFRLSLDPKLILWKPKKSENPEPY